MRHELQHMPRNARLPLIHSTAVIGAVNVFYSHLKRSWFRFLAIHKFVRNVAIEVPVRIRDRIASLWLYSARFRSHPISGSSSLSLTGKVPSRARIGSLPLPSP